jgi:hypothetical protein
VPTKAEGEMKAVVPDRHNRKNNAEKKKEANILEANPLDCTK